MRYNFGVAKQIESDPRLVDLLQGTDVLLLGENHLDPTLSQLLVAQADDLYRAGVRDVVLELGESEGLERIKGGRSAVDTYDWQTAFEPLSSSSSRLLDVALALSSKGISVHAGDKRSMELRKEFILNGTEMSDVDWARSHFELRNEAMSAFIADVGQRSTGAVILLVGAEHLAKGFEGLPSKSIPECLHSAGLTSRSAAAVGGLSGLTFEDVSAMSIDWALPSPGPFVPAAVTGLAFTGHVTEARELALGLFESTDPIVDYISGAANQRLPKGQGLLAARDHFIAGAEKGDVRQYVEAARMSFLLLDSDGAVEYARAAHKAGVAGALTLERAYRSQARLPIIGEESLVPTKLTVGQGL